LRTLQLGPEELLVGAKVELDPALSFGEVAQAIDEAERRVRARGGAVRSGQLPGAGLLPGRSAARASLSPDA
jgi:hypothetical protein